MCAVDIYKKKQKSSFSAALLRMPLTQKYTNSQTILHNIYNPGSGTV